MSAPRRARGAVSFATVGAIWLAHTTITEYLHHADKWLLRIDLLLLLVVSFLPFPTGLLADGVQHDEAGKVATTIYGLTLLTTASGSRCCGGTPSTSTWCGPMPMTTRSSSSPGS